jgi:hypothetical protein
LVAKNNLSPNFIYNRNNGPNEHRIYSSRGERIGLTVAKEKKSASEHKFKSLLIEKKKISSTWFLGDSL